MPASLPTIPGGSLIEKRVNSCSPSCRVRRTLNGEYLPAALLIAPASSPGWKGGVLPLGQGPPPTPLVTWNSALASRLRPVRGCRDRLPTRGSVPLRRYRCRRSAGSRAAPAGLRGRCRREFRERQLREVVEGSHQLPGLGVWCDLAGGLDEDPFVGDPGRRCRSRSASRTGSRRRGWSLSGRRSGPGTASPRLSSSSGDSIFDGPELRRVRAAFSRRRVDVSRPSRRRAGAQAFTGGGIDRRPDRQAHHGLLDLGLGDAGGVECRLSEWRLEVEPGRGVGGRWSAECRPRGRTERCRSRRPRSNCRFRRCRRSPDK